MALQLNATRYAHKRIKVEFTLGSCSPIISCAVSSSGYRPSG